MTGLVQFLFAILKLYGMTAFGIIVVIFLIVVGLKWLMGGFHTVPNGRPPLPKANSRSLVEDPGGAAKPKIDV